MAHPGDVNIVGGGGVAASSVDFSVNSDLLRSSTQSPPTGLNPEGAPIGSENAPISVISETGGERALPGMMGSPERTTPPQLSPPKLPPLLGTNIIHPAPEELKGDHAEGDAAAGEEQRRSQIKDLLATLECPVCLDTADRPPIYQCPEGHLLCENCNGRLVDCPQCGHALMNSRNRTAEVLAERLQNLSQGLRKENKALRGERLEDAAAPMVDIHIKVSEPQKIRKGLFSHIAYKMYTKASPTDGSRESNYEVNRRYSEVVTLYERLRHDYLTEGVIVPPPPGKERLTTIAVRMGAADPGSGSVVFERRCGALDRYMRRLARHPAIRRDPNFRSFLQEKEVPRSLARKKASLGHRMSESLSLFKARLFGGGETDPWFQTRQKQLEALHKQLREMKKDLRDMSNLKHRLHRSAEAFQRGLTGLLPDRDSRHLGKVIGEVASCHKTMSMVHDEQSRADELIVQLAIDYTILIEAADEAMQQRRKHHKEMQKVQKAKNALEEIEKIQVRFDKISQTLRRELEHFDFVMREEFDNAFTAYNASYWDSMKKISSHQLEEVQKE